MEKIHARLEARLCALERGEEGTLGREASWLREAKQMLAAGMKEAQSGWQRDFALMKGEQQQTFELLEVSLDVRRKSIQYIIYNSMIVLCYTLLRKPALLG